MKRLIRGLALLLAVCLGAGLCPAMAEGETPAYTDVAVLSTTDMHGKCWETNVLTGGAEKHNMLRVSTAVKEIRAAFGEENVLLIDNGDLYQGTQVSEYQLLQRHMGLSEDPLVMALCLKEMRYTASVLGNHEFNYPWEVMSETYRWLEENGVPVLAANVCHDGSEAGTEAGQQAFTPYIIRTVTVNGHEHKIGILGLENCDITRWDLPYNYPGLQFVHPGNDGFSMAEEAKRFLPEMREAGCEFIIVSYHGGLGNAESRLVFGGNSESQAMRLVAETADIDLLINGHDHSDGYSGQLFANAEGREIPMVNGGGQELTRTVFRFTEDENGALKWEMLESANLDPAQYDVDTELQEKVRPYAEMAERYVEQPVGIAGGEWDGSRDYHTRQTDSMDLVAKACIDMTTLRIAEMADEYGAAAVMAEAGTDHLDTDLSITTVTVSGNYVVEAGPVSMKDIYKLYRYANSILVIPMTGAQIRAVMEENATGRLAARVHGGMAFAYAKGDTNTHLIFGGLNFSYDLARPDGEKVVIEGFANGRPFEDDRVYLAAVNNYILGNARCGLRSFSAEDAIWAQMEGDGEIVQGLIAEYLTRQGTVTPADFGWHWEITYSGNTEDVQLPEGTEAGANMVLIPADGQQVIIYHEAEQLAMTGEPANGGLDAVRWEAAGEVLAGSKPEGAVVFTVHADENYVFRFSDPEGRWLVTTPSGNSLTLEKEPADEKLACWHLEPGYGGWYIVNEGARYSQALELYSGRFTTYGLSPSGLYTFNFYEPAEAGQ